MVLISSLALAIFFVWLTLTENKLAEPFLFWTVLTCSLLAIVLEVLSLGRIITLENTRLAFLGSILVCGAVTFRLKRQLSQELYPVRQSNSDEIHNYTIIEKISASLAASILLSILTATAFTAMSSIPNNWDSMTYHLPRVEYWLQNKSFEFYPVAQGRQIEMYPLAEKLILVARSIVPSISSANMVQWLSYCGCVLVVKRITRELGGSRSSQYLSSVIMATLPMAILESSSTQTDLVVAFFSGVSIYYLMRVRVGPPFWFLSGAILSAGLAFHAKGTAAIYLCGFVAVYGGTLMLKAKSPRFWIHAVAAVIIALLFVGPHLQRNFNRFGSPIGPESQHTITTEPNWRSTLFNAVRNLASNAGTEAAIPWTAWAGQTLKIADADERYTYLGMAFGDWIKPSYGCCRYHEDWAPNTAHVVILIFVIIMGSLRAALSSANHTTTKYLPLARYGLATAISVIAFCALLKWQPWITRYHLGLFALVTPPATALLSSLGVVSIVLMLILVLQAFPPTFKNMLRPIIGAQSITRSPPIDVLFRNRPDLQGGYVKLAREVAALRPKQVGLIFSGDTWEFPLWYILKQHLQVSDMPTIIHEMDEQAIDPQSDVIVYLEKAPKAVPDGMVEVPGFAPLRLYKRTP